MAALRFVHQYVRQLPEGNAKRVLLLTDGIHDPPPGSPHRGSPEAVAKAVQEAASAIRAEGWTVSIMKVPPEPAKADAGMKSYLEEIAKVLGVQVSSFRNGSGVNLPGLALGFPSLSFPAHIGKVGNRFVAPFTIRNSDRQNPILLGLVSVQSEGTELLEKKVQLTVPPGEEAVLEAPIRLPLSFPRGEHSREIQLVFQDELRISPTSGTLSFTYTGKGGLPIPRLTFLYILYILLAAAVIYLLVRLFLFMREKMHEVSLSGFSRAAGGRRPSPAQASPARAGIAARGRRLIPLMQAGAAAGSVPATGSRKPLPPAPLPRAGAPGPL